MLGTLGSWGLEFSPKGDRPGFVEIVDERTLLIPERSGNHLAIGLQNILAEPRIALMMFRPATDEVLRISGRAVRSTRIHPLTGRAANRYRPRSQTTDAPRRTR